MLTSDPDFVPPFCPNPDCRHHRDPAGWRWHHAGVFERQAEPCTIRRFRCVACGRYFSTQTFDTTYYLKKPGLQPHLHAALVSCSALRQVARAHDVAHSTAQRQASRLGRHCLLHLLSLPRPEPDEDLVLDGFVTFEYSQYHPFEVNFLVGAHSHFIYGCTHAELRRSGRMTDRQRERRGELETRHGRPDPKATEKSVVALVNLVAPEPRTLTVRSDEHRTYPRAFRQLPHEIRHSTVSSRRNRNHRNPLFAMDLLDLLIRHSRADQKRETIAFAKRGQGLLERLAVFVAWRNCIKRTSENRSDSLTPAQNLGLLKERQSRSDLLLRRHFPSRVSIPETLQPLYWRRIPTRMIPGGTVHALKYAA